MKGSYGDPENTGVGYNTIIKELGDHTVPAKWGQYVKHKFLIWNNTFNDMEKMYQRSINWGSFMYNNKQEK